MMHNMALIFTAGGLMDIPKEFTDFFDEKVRPHICVNDAELNKMDLMDFAEIAKRIDDDAVRKEFKKRAFFLLGDLIHNNLWKAQLWVEPDLDYTEAVVFSLVAAAIGWQLTNPATALLFAALAYWLIAKYIRNSFEKNRTRVRNRNSEVEGWAKTIEGWKANQTSLMRE